MKRRVCFKEDLHRKCLFSLVKYNPHLCSNSKLARYLGTCKSVIDKYLSGELTLPESRFSKLIATLPGNLHDTFNNEIYYKDARWGQIKGGKTTFSRHKEIFAYGRQVALKKRMPKYHVDANVELTADFCEFIGAFIGDGFIGKYDNSYMLQFTGDAHLDYAYFYQKLLPVAKSLFPNLKPRILIKENTIRMTFYSKELVLLFHKRFGFPLGKKCYTVMIPNEILDSGEEKIAATLRGIFDTDGCIFFDKRAIYSKPYPRIAINLCNKNLMKQISFLLRVFKLKPTITKDYERIQINSRENVLEFARKIGFSSERHLSKIKKISLTREAAPSS